MDLARNEMQVFSGIAASPGISVGILRIVDRRRISVQESPILSEQVFAEIERLAAAISDTISNLEKLKEQLAESTGQDHLFFIETHLMILSDERLLSETSTIISTACINAEGALQRTLQRYRDAFANIEDPYLKERIYDVETVIERVLDCMGGKLPEQFPRHEGQTVVAAHDITPADMLQIDRNKVLGVMTEIGGRTSHTAILARALELPMVAGVEGVCHQALDGSSVIVDGTGGAVIVNPDRETFLTYVRRRRHYEYLETELLKTALLPAVTIDGHLISLRGNVEIPEEGASVLKHGGMGVGLYRTEILFMNRPALPDEEEQYLIYRSMLQAVHPYPLTIRTLDAGGDKLLDGVSHTNEQNPALGLRAIRLSLGMPEEFKKQLRAILRVSADGPVRIMFPMISGVSEVRAAMALLNDAKAELAEAGTPFDDGIEVGLMIEIPAAVTMADQLAREVDFFSVGTNDLIQYTLAVDRTNEHLSGLYQPLHPAVLHSLRRIVEAAHQAGIEACLCGEMAGDPLYLPVLLGLGFDELSMGSQSLLKVKQILRRCTIDRARQIAAGCFQFDTAEDVEQYLKQQITLDVAESFD